MPDNSEAKKGLIIIETEFPHLALDNTAKILIKNQELPSIIDLKNQIRDIKGVQQIIWLDDYVDLTTTPIEYIPEEIKNNFYREDKALFTVIFDENIDTAIEEINELLENNGGVGLETRSVVEVASTAVIFAIIIIVLIIVLFTDSFMSALLMLITLGVAICLNLGTNIIFGDISNITLIASAVIQLAVSIDYTLIFMKNFNHARNTTPDLNKAIIKANVRSSKTIVASALTTIAGFLALGVMNYRIGSELGFVLAKGVLFSLLSVGILLPLLVKVSIKAINKTKHKALLPSVNFLSKVIQRKVAIVLLFVLIGLAVVGFYGQSNNKFIYSDNHTEYTKLEKEITKSFGEFNEFVLIIPKGDTLKEQALINDINQLDFLKNRLVPSVEEQVPGLASNKYLLYNITFNLPRESEKTFTMVETVREIAAKYYDEAYLTGESVIINDIKQVVEEDYLFVILISLLAIFLIILFTFKSISLPIILLLVIQTAIWINMSIPYLQGTKLSFLGYILISSIQLGATIDYAIIYTEHYEKERQNFDPKTAAKKAFTASSQSIIISMIALIIAGFSLTIMIDMNLVKELGILIGRGTLISGILTLIFLPQILVLLDKIISKTTHKRKIL